MASDLLIEQIKDKLVTAAKNRVYLTEEELCKAFNVSRGPIRDSLQHLEKQGLIERKTKRGTALREPSIKEFIELWDFRTAIEGFAARLACPNLTPDDVKELEALIGKREEASQQGDEKTADDADQAFHKRIVEFSGNSFLISTVENLHLFERVFKIYNAMPRGMFPAANDKLNKYNHQAVLEALRVKDADQAEQTMRFHLQEGKKNAVEALLGRVNLFEETK